MFSKNKLVRLYANTSKKYDKNITDILSKKKSTGHV